MDKGFAPIETATERQPSTLARPKAQAVNQMQWNCEREVLNLLMTSAPLAAHAEYLQGGGF